MKGSKKAPAKQAKNPDESLKEELDELRKLEVYGWILIGFPRTLTQMKLLEQSLSGYESKCDQPKPRQQQFQDAWAKISVPCDLVAPGYDGQINVAASGFDGVIFMEM